MHRRSNRLLFCLIGSVIALPGCGGSSVPVSPAVPVVAQQQQRFAVPQALHRAIPPAPPNVIPKAPSVEERAALQSALRSFVPRKPAEMRRASATAATAAAANPVVRFETSLGNIDVELQPNSAPKNVANFLSYVNSSGINGYNGSFIHRSQPSFVIQGGGYDYTNGETEDITQQAAVANEYGLSNVRGTLAMALTGNDINSATDEWFFNLADNSGSLNSQKYTVIGNIETTDGLAVMDAIAALQTVDASNGNSSSPFTMLPVQNYTSGQPITASNLVEVSSVATQPPHPGFFNGEVSVGNAVNYLAFPSGNYFGYYSYLTDEDYIYHFDLGYEYVFDAADGKDGVYLYDFASDTYFYTSPSFPFPYLYDFSLKSVLYYYPDTSSAGHYTTNPRYFYNFSTGAIITK